MKNGGDKVSHKAHGKAAPAPTTHAQPPSAHRDANGNTSFPTEKLPRSERSQNKAVGSADADDAPIASEAESTTKSAAGIPFIDEPLVPTKAEIVRQYELIERVKAYDPDCDEDMLNRAYVYSMVSHGGQTRKNGDPYFTHPIAVAAILTELKADPQTIITALLHDTVEDTDVTIADIETRFGSDIAKMVDGVTKISKIELKSQDTAQAENFRKFVLAMAQDVRVLVVKLADRLHNMRTLHFVPSIEKRQKTALETMEIYVPLAGRIGVQKFREELEDLSFLYLNPEGYRTIKQGLERMHESTVHTIVELSQDLRSKLSEKKIKADVYSREKRPFSIWSKMQRKGTAFEELADIYAFRVIVESVSDCYAALGVIHQAFPMIHGEFDDYISTPKPNFYRSIHTAVLAPGGVDGHRQRVEIQIRTREMHDNAERGVAAHWKYKDQMIGDGARKSIEIESKDGYDPYEWMRVAVEMLQHGEDANDFLENAKLELFNDQVFCFTPRGRVIALPSGATTLDFAYAVHTKLGDACVGGRINGVTRPLRTVLKNGDVVEVLKSSNAPVPDEWRSLVVSGRAKIAITRRVKKLHREEQIRLGRKLVESEFAAHALPHTDHAIEAALSRLGFGSIEAVYEAVGRLDLPVKKVREASYPGASEGTDKNLDSGQSVFTGRRRPIPIEGFQRGMTVTLASCCSPLPGERIVGLPDKKHGVMVHRIDCHVVDQTSVPETDWLDLRWRDEMTTAFIARLLLTMNNKIGALAHVSATLARYGADVTNITLRNREVEFTDMVIDIEVKDAKHLSNVLTALRASEHVLSAERRQDDLLEDTSGTISDHSII